MTPDEMKMVLDYENALDQLRARCDRFRAAILPDEPNATDQQCFAALTARDQRIAELEGALRDDPTKWSFAALVTIAQLILDRDYRADVFDGSSGDPGALFVVALTSRLNRDTRIAELAAEYEAKADAQQERIDDKYGGPEWTTAKRRQECYREFAARLRELNTNTEPLEITYPAEADAALEQRVAEMPLAKVEKGKE